MKPQCPDAEAALTAALDVALGQPPHHRLFEVTFGRFAAAEAGWWYSLRFLVEFTLNENTTNETIVARMDKIIRAWAADVVKYREADEQASSGRI